MLGERGWVCPWGGGSLSAGGEMRCGSPHSHCCYQCVAAEHRHNKMLSRSLQQLCKEMPAEKLRDIVVVFASRDTEMQLFVILFEMLLGWQGEHKKTANLEYALLS